MKIEWTPDLAVGSPAIDDQHKELFHRVDQLLEACNQGKGRDTVGGLLKFLEEYVVTHFGTEEEYMTRFAYPKMAEHQAQHEQFVQSLAPLKEAFAKEGPGLNLVILTNRIIINWLNAHIRNVDKQLGAFLKDKL
ncbi:hemerythrin [Hydrogenispora ethanolica]|uniref:Hemerythrin n=1 Tax=Hydrogenispora ethanolica TaxID=1082276 RepID=A0A4R1S026_HYDET|nr:bacteriohemerythrin [Hydrogenispora ethanolica]TCL72428.1 hemerythrin [Hydrogenispora ethanolica]